MSHKRAVLFLNGEIKDFSKIKKIINNNDLLIGVDGGTKHILKLGLKPDFIIGDLDSYTPKNKSIPVIKYPIDKDFTDSELAIKFVIEKKYDEIIIFAFAGDRLDHMISNLLVFASLPANIMIYTDNQEFYFVKNKLEITGQKNDLISLIPLFSDCQNVTTSNLKFPLNDETMAIKEGRGISNVMLSTKATVSLKSGTLLLIKTTI